MSDIGQVKTAWKLTLASALLATSSCGEGGRNSEGKPWSQASVSDAARSGARFRYVGRDVYRASLMESCEVDPALLRATVLARENAALRNFEVRMRSGPAAHHLEVARSDVEFRRASGALGCWQDSDPRFAELHVQMARESVRRGVDEMEKMVSELAPLGASMTGLASPDKAEFRSLARTIIESLTPLCVITSTASNEEILGPARAELARFGARLQPTPYALHFALAEADALYERSQTVAECADPGSESAADVARNALHQTRRQIAQLVAVARL